MSLVAAWVLFPLLLLGILMGCGLLVERLVREQLPGALIPAVGLGVVVVVGQYLTLSAATAELTVPAIVLLAVIGAGLGRRRAWCRLDRSAVAAGLVAFAALAAPIVLSGDATFAGYIKLDDTATWMALTDRVMEGGRSLDGLAPSTYEATLAFNLGDGYPIGAFVPLGVASELSGQDVAWTIQPYMAVLGVLLAWALWQLAAPLVGSRWLRTLVAVIGSQSALLFGYYLWGGIKETAAAALLATAVGLAAFALAHRGHPRSLLPLALTCAAMIGVLSAGGAIWLMAPLAGALVLLVATVGPAMALRAAAACVGLVVVFALPALVAGGLLPPTSSPLTSDEARGNLIEPLTAAQVAGIWPARDFRLDPAQLELAYMLIAVALATAAWATVVACRRREWTLALYVGGALVACFVILAFGSPWIDAKALAIASPAIPFAAALGAAILWRGGRRTGGAVLLVAVAGGVLWSNVLQYRDVSLAPRDRLAELERIGESIDGDGPTLMTEYQPYGVRHFLRRGDPEGASELRRRPVPLIGGGTLAKGESADIDRFQRQAVLVYRTLVLRRSSGRSRPPPAYGLTWTGDFYEVWQRPEPAG